MYIERIKKPNDIKNISKEAYTELAEEIREFLVDSISKTGGHLASNLGVVELTIALHTVLDFPTDKLIWDVGHQSYTHKILTGRKDYFDSLRTYGGMSGFPKRRESKCDCFDTGHSSTSISAGLGIVKGYELSQKSGNVVSVIGDGALTGGMAFEALNNASKIKRNFIIVLNDNNMSISENVGGMSKYLTHLRTGSTYNGLKEGVTKSLEAIPVLGDKLVHQIRKTKSGIKQLVIPGMLFEDMGITYLGPVDGHNIDSMIKVFNEAKKVEHAVIVHVITKKGKGYQPAEKHPDYFHGIEPFDKKTGLIVNKRDKANYTDVFAKSILFAAQRNDKVVAITAAMADGTGLKKFKEAYPNRFFDVGIAEEHAVTFAAGLAMAGFKPFFAVYSSFLQRAYDQILHDVCIQDLPVTFMIDRAGLVGSDGETHQGIFDISYLSSIPNMSIIAPKNKYELRDAMDFATYYNGPLAIRYPRGTAYTELKEFRAPFEYGKSECIYKERDIAILAVGSMVKTAIEVREELKDKGFSCTLINVRFVKPFDQESIDELVTNHNTIVTIEENVYNGSYGEKIQRYIGTRDYRVKVVNIAIPNIYVEHGNIEVLMKACGLDKDSIVNKIEERIKSI